MNTVTKEQLIEELKSSTQNASGMFEISEDTICALMSLLTNAAPQLPQQTVTYDAATAIRACLDEFPEGVRDIVEECAAIAESTCRADKPAPAYVPDEMPEPDTARMFFTDAVVAIAKVQGWNACRAAMLHRSEPETDNTTQQFESLSRGDK